MRKFMGRHLQGRKVVALVVVTNFVLALMLAVTMPLVTGFSKGMELLDMMPTGYDEAYVHALFDTLGPEGRNAYLTFQLPLDMVYPGLFALSYCLLLAYFLNRADRFEGPLSSLCALPLVAGLADYLENMGIMTLLLSFPILDATIVSLTSFCSLVKSSATTAYFMALMAVLLDLGVKSLRKKSR